MYVALGRGKNTLIKRSAFPLFGSSGSAFASGFIDQTKVLDNKSFLAVYPRDHPGEKKLVTLVPPRMR